MINLLAYDADPTGVTNSGPALQSAINALGSTNGTLLVVPPGTYLLTTGVVRNFIGAGNATAITIRGEGSATIFKIAVGATGRALRLQNLESVLLDDITFASSTTNGAAIDARNTLSLEYCRKAIIRNCGFYGLTTVRGGAVGTPAGAVVYAHQTDLRIENCSFRGCAGDYTIGTTPFDGTPIVDCDKWNGLSVTDTEFIDWGSLNGVAYTGATHTPSSAWIRVGKPAPRVGPYPQAASGQSRIVLRNVRLDEGAFYGIAIKSPSDCEPVSHVSLSGLMINGFNVGAPGSGSAIYINRVDDVVIEQSWIGWTEVGPRVAIHLADAKNATIDGVFCDLARGMTKFMTAGDTNLTIRNSVFSEPVIES